MKLVCASLKSLKNEVDGSLFFLVTGKYAVLLNWGGPMKTAWIGGIKLKKSKFYRRSSPTLALSAKIRIYWLSITSCQVRLNYKRHTHTLVD